jgi:hypothetical protein
MRTAIAAAFLLAAGCTSVIPQTPPPPAPADAPEVRAVRVRDPVVVDGVENDAGWRVAPESRILLEGASSPDSLRVKAAVSGETLNLLVLLRTEERGRPLELEGPAFEMKERAPGAGDEVTVEFPIAGAFDPASGVLVQGERDLWRWNSVVSDPTGHAEDLHGVAGDILGDASQFTRGDSVRESADDVLARGQWRDDVLTIEFARARSTGFNDDRDLGDLKEVPFRIRVRRGGSAVERSSPVLRLLLPPPEVEPRGPLAEPLGPSGTGR